jgi:hypothetical protein
VGHLNPVHFAVFAKADFLAQTPLLLAADFPVPPRGYGSP